MVNICFHSWCWWELRNYKSYRTAFKRCARAVTLGLWQILLFPITSCHNYVMGTTLISTQIMLFLLHPSLWHPCRHSIHTAVAMISTSPFGATRQSWSWRNELELEARAVAGAAECHRLLQRCNGKHSYFSSNSAIPVTSCHSDVTGSTLISSQILLFPLHRCDIHT